MSVNLSPIGNSEQFFDNNGIPLSGGLLYTYQAGSSTPLSTYTTLSGTVANANPIVLNSAGRFADAIWLTYGYFYKFVLKDASDNLIGTYDNIYGIVGVQSAVGTTIPTGLISLWYGAIGSVPTGWYLCDGSNGTPDLRDRFVVGAGSTYAVSATGGYTDAEIVNHTHSATTAIADAGHSHGSIYSFGPGGGANYPIINAGISNTGAGQSTTTNVSVGITATTTVIAAGNSPTNRNLPPYYALAYVMKS